MTADTAPPARSADPRRLATLAATGLLDSPSEERLDRWCRLAARLTASDSAAITLVDGTRQVLEGAVGMEGWVGQRGAAPVSPPTCRHVAAGAAPLRVRDARTHPLLADAPAVRTGSVVGYAGTPLVVRGQVLGSLCAVTSVPRDWSDADMSALADVAAAVAAEAELRLSAEELRVAEAGLLRSRELIRSHNRVHERIARGDALDAVLIELLGAVERYDDAIRATIMLLEEDGTLRAVAAPSMPASYLHAMHGVAVGPETGTCGAATYHRRAEFTPDIAADPRWAPFRLIAREHGLAHCWSVPVLAAGGAVLGTLAFYGGEPREPEPALLEVMQDAARVAGIAIERARSTARLRHEATHDPLTGLPNRTHVFGILTAALERAADVAVLFVDLDKLKLFNDTLGHDLGDDVLRQLARRIAAAAGPRATAGRFGGDEFVVIAEGIQDAAQAAALGERLLRAVSAPLTSDQQNLMATASVGIALPDPDADAREVLRQADSAMYTAKGAGGNRVRLYEEEMRPHAARRLRIGNELRRAAERHELHLAYQPIFDIHGTRLAGVEALLRWTSPRLGGVRPSEFIPIAEDTGQIPELGDWILREACRTVGALMREHGVALQLGVNVSALQVEDPDLPAAVARALADTGFDAGSLVLEITETALLHADARTAATLAELKRLGASVVLDDFGTGFSSLALLKRHPVDAIKIDRSFVAGLPDDAEDCGIVAATIAMARALDRRTTAEGVERREQLDALRELGCDRVQGYLLARPLDAGGLAELLAARAA